MVATSAIMYWYSMFERIHSVRVMGVVQSFLAIPFCRSSVFRSTVPNRLKVITAMAMMPGMKKSMNRYLLVRMDFSTGRRNGGVRDISRLIPATTRFRISTLAGTEEELGS